MTERERLIELCKKANKEWLEKEYNGETKKSISTYVADYLLENGVIVPPCKVGRKVFVIYDGYVTSARILAFYIDGIGGMCDLSVLTREETAAGFESVICKDRTWDEIFLTLEEAEKALKEREE